MKKRGFCQIKDLRKELADLKAGHYEKPKCEYHRAQLRVISIERYSLLSQESKSASC